MSQSFNTLFRLLIDLRNKQYVSHFLIVGLLFQNSIGYVLNVWIWKFRKIFLNRYQGLKPWTEKSFTVLKFTNLAILLAFCSKNCRQWQVIRKDGIGLWSKCHWGSSQLSIFVFFQEIKILCLFYIVTVFIYFYEVTIPCLFILVIFMCKWPSAILAS